MWAFKIYILKPADNFLTFFFKDFIYLFMRDTERERQRHRQREKQAPRREPDVGLDPQTPGSTPWARGRCSTTESVTQASLLVLFFFFFFFEELPYCFPFLSLCVVMDVNEKCDYFAIYTNIKPLCCTFERNKKMSIILWKKKGRKEIEGWS